MRTLKYSAGAALSTAVMVAGFAAPVGATPVSSNMNYWHHTPTTTTTNIDSNNTLNYTKTYTKTVDTTVTNTNTFTNSGIVQTQVPSSSGHTDHGNNSDHTYGQSGSGGSQTAVQGTKSGVYHVDISQSQSTSQRNETSNETMGQANMTMTDNNAPASHDQTNTQTNSNTQTLNQSNTTTQTMSVNQSAQGVVVN